MTWASGKLRGEQLFEASRERMPSCRGVCDQGRGECPNREACQEDPLAVFVGIRNAALFTLGLVVVIAGVAALWP